MPTQKNKKLEHLIKIELTRKPETVSIFDKKSQKNKWFGTNHVTQKTQSKCNIKVKVE